MPITHEACDGGKTETFDVNNDGKPDITKHFDGGHEKCRESDLNRDGRPDLFQYFTDSGELRRRESDYNDDGLPNLVEYFQGGKLVKRELDTTGRGYVDTWDTIDGATGKVVKRERDTTGRGRIDQWWSWEGDQLTIQVDRDGDGKPDADATMLMSTAGGSLSPILAPSGAAGAPGAPGAGGADGGAPAAATTVAPATPPTPAPSSSLKGPSPGDTPMPYPLDADAGIPKARRGGAKR